MNPILSTLWTDAWLGLAAGGIAVASLPWLDRNNSLHRMVVCVVAIVLMWRYMAWPFFGSLPELGLPPYKFAGITFAVTELLSMLSTTMSMIFPIRTRDRTPEVES